MLLRLICKIGSGGTAPQKPAEYCCNGLTFIKASNLDDIINDQSEVKACKITKESAQYHRYKEYPPQTILFAKSGISCTKNRVYITKEKSFIVNHLCALVVISSKINPKWLMLFISHFNVTCLIKDNSYPSISLESIGNIEVPIISLKKQQEIISSIDRIKVAIKEKGHQLEAFDSLAKSRFNEMFFTKDFPIKQLKSLCMSKAQYGAQSASCPFEDGRPRYVRITDIIDNGSLGPNIVCSANKEDDVNFKLEFGDFLFARMGATVGKTFMFSGGNQIYAGYLIRYKLNQSLLNPSFLLWYTKTPEYSCWVKNSQSGSAQPGINARKYDSLPILCPPIVLQKKFSNFVDLIDKSKFVGHSRYFL